MAMPIQCLWAVAVTLLLTGRDQHQRKEASLQLELDGGCVRGGNATAAQLPHFTLKIQNIFDFNGLYSNLDQIFNLIF